jgi:zinc transport system substrate-binding protein
MKTFKLNHFFQIIALMTVCLNATFAKPLSIITTIRPVYGLVSAITNGVDEPKLLLQGAQSPHHAQLKPTQISQLQTADVIIMIDPTFEHFMSHALTSLPESTTVITLSQTPQLISRQHDHHGHLQLDGHLWLSPINAMHMVDTITAKLSKKNPEAKITYQANAKALKTKIKAMDHHIKELLAPVKKAPFMVFHDGYHYFSSYYELNDQGALLLEPNDPLKAQKLLALEDKITQHQLDCVFQDEPAQPRLSRFLAETMKVPSQTLDPLGTQLNLNPDLYPQLMLSLTHSFRKCFIPNN